MERIEENRENMRNVDLNVACLLNGESSGSQRSVASSLTDLETQQPPNHWKSAKEVGEKLRKFLYKKMPSVFYDGPNGKKTKGHLLYSFTKREDLKIVCACHASFFTPAEFIKHGGGGDVDVENPLNYIIIILDY
ncbi:ninja-family protein AFP3-like [Solanum pennellii]|uniref:Ninja-family protein n=1 Tax=Solanum pennellii TaxID=28526 RepID=A0ABM1G1U1_SOLPN|nr:ninja-family protein AFP3-like [Solanum pennellii]